MTTRAAGGVKAAVLPSAPDPIAITDGTIDLHSRRVRRPGGETHLTDLEAGLLAFLAARPGLPVGVDVLLKEVWGHTRTVETRAVHNTVRRLRGKIERDPAEPVHLRTVFALGFVWEPPASGAPQERPAARPPLPPRPADVFVGRAPELLRMSEAQRAGARLLCLVGPGGIGKTRLALTWLHTLPAPYVTGLCEATGLTTVAALRDAVAAWLGAAATDDIALGAALRALGPTALLLDGIGPGVGLASLTAWLGQAPELLLLTTSRAQPEDRGACILHVPPLPAREPPDEAGSGGALFFARARTAGAQLRADEATADSVRAVLARVGGVPRALEVLAARLGSLPLPALVATLDTLEAPPDRPVRADTLMSWSWGAVTAPERALTCTLALFADGFTLSAAQHILGVPPDHALALLDRLVRAGILTQPDPLTGRFAFLPLIRAALRRALADTPDAERVGEDRLLTWALALDPTPLDPLPATARVAARCIELPNLAAAVHIATARRAFETAARIGLVLARGHELVGPRSAEMELLDALLAEAAALDPLTAAALRLRRFALTPNLGGPGGGAALDALAASLPPDAHTHHAQVHLLRSAAHVGHGRHAEARAEVQRMLERAHASGLAGLRLRGAALCTRVHAVSGDPGAIAIGVEGSQAAVQQGLLSAEVDLALATSRACHLLGRAAEARAHADRAIEAIDRLEASIGASLPLLRLSGLGERLTVVHWQRDPRETTAAAAALASLAARLSERTLLSEAEQLLAWASILQGDAAAAMHHALAARAAVDPHGRPRLWWAAQTWLGVARLLLGDVPGTIDVLEPAVARWAEFGEGLGDVAAGWLAVACAADGRPAAAWLTQMDTIPAGREGVPASERAAAREVVRRLEAGARLHPALPVAGSFSALAAALPPG